MKNTKDFETVLFAAKKSLDMVKGLIEDMNYKVEIYDVDEEGKYDYKKVIEQREPVPEDGWRWERKKEAEAILPIFLKTISETFGSLYNEYMW